jgi:hypothetical protein
MGNQRGCGAALSEVVRHMQLTPAHSSHGRAAGRERAHTNKHTHACTHTHTQTHARTQNSSEYPTPQQFVLLVSSAAYRIPVVLQSALGVADIIVLQRVLGVLYGMAVQCIGHRWPRAKLRRDAAGCTGLPTLRRERLVRTPLTHCSYAASASACRVPYVRWRRCRALRVRLGTAKLQATERVLK